jgi:hypothetical protein
MADNSNITTLTSTDASSADNTQTPVTGSQIGVKRAIDTNIAGPLSSFGEVLIAEPTPSVQIDALHGIRSEVHETFTGPSGSNTIKDDHGGKEFHCQSGTTSGGYGLLRSLNTVRYRPGQGGRMRFTARFGTPVALSAQRAGGVNIGTELSFGYNGLDFGLLHRTGGRLEIQTLTISAAASGNETLTLTLNDIEYTISLTSGTIPHNAFEIVDDDGFAATHNAYQNGNTVVFISIAVGPETGTFSFSSTGTAAGTFAQTGAGVAVTDNFINQEDWNVTSVNTANNPFALDPSKGNVYQIDFQYLGYGRIQYSVEDPNTGNFIPVHVIKYANANTAPNLETPNFKIGWFAASLGATTNTEIYGASAFGGTDGKITTLKNPTAHSHTKASIGTTLTNILSVRVRANYNGYLNLAQVFPQFVSFASDGAQPVVCEIHINATLGGEPNWAYHDEDSDITEHDIASTTVTGDNEILVLILGKSDSEAVDLSKYNIKLNRTEVITLAAKATGGTSDVTATLTWTED